MRYADGEAVTSARMLWESTDATQSGFTLIEVLIAISLTALIAGVMGSAIRLGIRSLTVADKRTELFERFKNSLNMIDAQVEAEIPMLYLGDVNAKRFSFSGDRSQTSFASNYSIWRGAKGYVIVEYRIEGDSKGKQVLHALERVPGITPAREVKLLDGLDEAYFEYFWRDNRNPGGTWVDQWTDPSSIPEKMRLHLAQGKKRLSMVMPLRARGYADWIIMQDTSNQ